MNVLAVARQVLYSSRVGPLTPEGLRLAHRQIQDEVFSILPAWGWDPWELALFGLELERALISKLKY
jgi:hypothetical protein